MKNRFKLGDILTHAIWDIGTILITSIEGGYYRAKYIEGRHDWRCLVFTIAWAGQLRKIGNILDIQKERRNRR